MWWSYLSGLVLALVWGNHAIGGAQIRGVLRIATAVLVLETNPEVPILLPIHGTKVHNGESFVATQTGKCLVVFVVGEYPQMDVIGIGSSGNGTRVQEETFGGVLQSINQAFVAANGASVMLKSIDEGLKLVK